MASDSAVWTIEPIMHRQRRKTIIEEHPEVAALFGHDMVSALFCFLTVVFQLISACILRDASWWVIVPCAYFLSGTANHSLVLAIHEMSHELFFPWKWANKWFSIFANLPICLPMAVTFKRYHLEHHASLGVDGVDMDLPSAFEAALDSFLGRAVFVILQPVFYGLRPLFVNPKPISTDEVVNIIVQLSFDAAIVYFLGGRALAYLSLGTLLGLGPHPSSGHYYAEHYLYESIEGVPVETHSYYGPMNHLNYNVGYHVEHHDFPKIPGRRLPLLKAKAGKHYDLPHHKSWTRAMVDFVRYGSFHGRIKRKEHSKID